MDAMGTVMLVCAVAASLALGVLVAYGICQAMFRVFRLHVAAEARNRALQTGRQVAQAAARQAVSGAVQVAVQG